MIVNSKILVSDIGQLPTPVKSSAVELGIEKWLYVAKIDPDVSMFEFVKACIADTILNRLFAFLFSYSPFLMDSITENPQFTRLLIEKGTKTALKKIYNDLTRDKWENLSEKDLMQFLRQSKRQFSLGLALADIFENWSVAEVSNSLSVFAENVLHLAINSLLTSAHERGEINLPFPKNPEKETGLIVLAMGKLGAKELNYSSDIDLIILFDREKTNYTGTKTIQEFFVNLAKNLIKILEERTIDGYVFRTDLRLRPDPRSTPLAISTIAAETYYETTGQNWERAAMIKARPVAGDLKAGKSFLKTLRPFIWRRSLDFEAIEDIHSIKRQVNKNQGDNKISSPGHNIKLGRGGIREIELFAQTQQLIWGGRDITLRNPRTCETLHKLAEAGHITEQCAIELENAYLFLRRTEHRLQMIHDKQTHVIPTDSGQLNSFSIFLGYRNVENFSKDLVEQLDCVERHSSILFEHSPDLGGPGSLVFTGEDDHPDTLSSLKSLGFIETEKISSIIRTWHLGRFRATRSERAKQLLTKLMPIILNTFSKTDNPDLTLIGFNEFLKRLPSGIQLFSLFNTNPGLLGLIATIMGTAPKLAETLQRYPILLDAVLTDDFFQPLPPPACLSQEFEKEIDLKSRDYQDTLDIVRRLVNDRLFKIGVQILKKDLKPEAAGEPLSNLCDTALKTLFTAVKEEFAKNHGHLLDGNFAVVALGKLGGREITINSDIDLFFVYQGNTSHSSGQRSLPKISYFNRLSQRYISALTVSTVEGPLFDLDLRLRPSGEAGPIATSFSSLSKYFHNDAWVWEKMALTRARVVFAEGSFRGTLENLICSLLRHPPDKKALLKGAAEMRFKLLQRHPSTQLWDIKHMRGGFVDIEFIAQYLQLLHAYENPTILSTNTAEGLNRLSANGLIENGKAKILIDAMILWHKIQGILRLCARKQFIEDLSTEGLQNLLTITSGMDSFSTLKSEVNETARNSHSIFQEIIENPAKKL